MIPFEVPITVAEAANRQEIVDRLGMRGKMDTRQAVESVERIVAAIRKDGDAAIVAATEQFDRVTLTPGRFRVSEAEIEEACASIDPALMDALRRASDNILAFHLEGLSAGFLRDSGDGAVTGQLVRPLDTVGVYVPGGTAPLPSSVLMNLLPARAAGVRRIVMCTPPSRDGSVHAAILAAARVAGADEIYRIGGAQAIAAMAYGTATIPRVDKICGPGNIYVNTAKRMVFGQVDIDMFAGPSEILVIADDSANPDYLAADMLSQAEHDVLASAILVTDSATVAERTAERIRIRASRLPRREIVERSLADFAAILLVPDLDTAVDFANELAPEHLEIVTANPAELLVRIRNAGAVFLGAYSPEPLGDYFAGPNHILPTSGTARFFSPLSAADFFKRINVIHYTRNALDACRADIERLAEAEGLPWQRPEGRG